MANINCKKCGAEIEETTNFCPNCGFKNENQELCIKEPKNKKSKIVIIAIIALVVVVLALGTYLFISKYYLPKNSYEEGLSLMEKHNYSAAIEAFEKSNGYADAEEKISEIENIQEENEISYKLRRAYDKCTYFRTVISSDGLSISVDSTDKYDSDGIKDIRTIINELDLPDSLIDAMESTNALMGRQKETYGDYEVSWSYHPDNGLDAIFRIII